MTLITNGTLTFISGCDRIQSVVVIITMIAFVFLVIDYQMESEWT